MDKFTTIINPIVNPITNNPFVLGPQGPYETENEAIENLSAFYKDIHSIPRGQQVVIQGDIYVWNAGLHRLAYENEIVTPPNDTPVNEGLSTSAKIALIECLQSMAFATDKGANKIDKLMKALNITKDDFLIDGYVKDGLVFYLDANSVSAGDTTWSSKVGDYTFTNTKQHPNYNAPFGFVKQDNGVLFNGNFAWLSPLTELTDMFLTTSNGTLEVVFKHLDNTNKAESIFVTYNGDNQLEFIKGLWYRGSTGAYICKLQKHYKTGLIGFYNDKCLTPTTVSVTYDNAQASSYVQAVKKEFSASGGTMPASYYCIGGRATGNTADDFYFMNGIVYSIRYYNRCLTDEEIAANMRADSVNYNL